MNSFLKDYWQWLISVVISFLGLIVALLKFFWKKDKDKDKEQNNSTKSKMTVKNKVKNWIEERRKKKYLINAGAIKKQIKSEESYLEPLDGHFKRTVSQCDVEMHVLNSSVTFTIQSSLDYNRIIEIISQKEVTHLFEIVEQKINMKNIVDTIICLSLQSHNHSHYKGAQVANVPIGEIGYSPLVGTVLTKTRAYSIRLDKLNWQRTDHRILIEICGRSL